MVLNMNGDRKNHYDVLGVPSSASFREIKDAFIQMAKKLHPDKRSGVKGADERFREITEAYRVLSDSVLRYVYDMELGIEPEADVVPLGSRLEEPSVTGNKAADYVETIAGGLALPVLTEIEERVFEVSGMETEIVKKAYSAGLYSFKKLSGLSMLKYYECGMDALRNEKFQPAVYFLSEAVKMNPKNLQYAFALGKALEGEGEKEKAAAEYRKVIEMGKAKGYNCLPVREALINSCLKARDYNAVEEQAKEILKTGLNSIIAESAMRFIRSLRKNGFEDKKNEKHT
jgi:curved DNA-binding protein CbpA